jgi:hypothetical protein
MKVFIGGIVQSGVSGCIHGASPRPLGQESALARGRGIIVGDGKAICKFSFPKANHESTKDENTKKAKAKDDDASLFRVFVLHAFVMKNWSYDTTPAASGLLTDFPCGNESDVLY